MATKVKKARKERKTKKAWRYKRGDIYLANLNPFKGSEQGGTRPVVVWQNDVGNVFSPTVIASIISSQEKKRNQPTHYRSMDLRGLNLPSVIMTEQIKTLDKDARIIQYLGRMTADQMRQAEVMLLISLGFLEHNKRDTVEEALGKWKKRADAIGVYYGKYLKKERG